MKLTIVIPALNEELAIAAIIERTLDARHAITTRSPVHEVEIIVVSDGSTDRTADIAAEYADRGVRLIVFEKNHGYGAAIKKGFETGSGELVGFLDADGTCDPCFFADLCNALVEENAAVALGSRLGPRSHMPRLRRLGNRLYAVLLSALSNRAVSDTASGMRVIRRDALARLYPLPDGLHFTPAMSARVLMDDQLHIVERPMPYEERVGESKLSVVRDGLRFLRTILHMTMMWRPARLFLSAAAVCLVSMFFLAAYPTEMWLRLGRLNEDMIYRLLACSLLGTAGVCLLSAGVLADQIHALVAPRRRTFTSALLDRLFSLRGWMAGLVPAVPLLVWLVGPGLWTRLTAGVVTIHWSRVVLAGLLIFALGEMLLTVLLANIIRFHAARGTGTAAPPSRLPRRELAISSREQQAVVN